MDWDHTGKALYTTVDGAPFNVRGPLELVVHVDIEGDEMRSDASRDEIPDEKLVEISPTFAAIEKRAREAGSATISVEEILQINADAAAYRATQKPAAGEAPPAHEHMSATQQRVVASLTEEAPALYSTLVAALRAHAAAFELPPIEDDEEDEEPEMFAELFDDPSLDDEDDEEGFEDEEDFESQFEIQRIEVYRNSEIGVVGHAEFEPEHGFAALMWDGLVTEIGYTDLANRT